MKKFLLPLFIPLFLISLNACCQEIVDQTIGDLTPKYSKGEIVKHTYYTLSYSEENEQPYWVFYRLTPDFLNSSIDRTDDFRPDPSVSTGSAALIDYSGSGYDRGHLAPAGYMKINDTSISESFFMSNMSPQLPGFNRGGWPMLCFNKSWYKVQKAGIGWHKNTTGNINKREFFFCQSKFAIHQQKKPFDKNHA